MRTWDSLYIIGSRRINMDFEVWSLDFSCWKMQSLLSGKEWLDIDARASHVTGRHCYWATFHPSLHLSFLTDSYIPGHTGSPPAPSPKLTSLSAKSFKAYLPWPLFPLTKEEPDFPCVTYHQYKQQFYSCHFPFQHSHEVGHCSLHRKKDFISCLPPRFGIIFAFLWTLDSNLF